MWTITDIFNLYLYTKKRAIVNNNLKTNGSFEFFIREMATRCWGLQSWSERRFESCRAVNLNCYATFSLVVIDTDIRNIHIRMVTPTCWGRRKTSTATSDDF